MDETRLRDKYSLAFRPPSPPLPLQWREMTDDEIMALEIPGVDPNAPPTLHADQVDMAICEKLREIDNNMAAVHSVLAYQILPGLKEYARVTEPIREVSRFWISMFESACAPKEQLEPVVENEGLASHDASATTPTAGSSSRTPTATSSTHTDSQMGIATSSEDPSFQAFSQSDGQNGLMTSTPVAHRARQASNKIFNKEESMDSSIADESLRTRMRRQMENLQLDASLDMSDTTESTAPISLSTVSSSLSSAQPKGEQVKPSIKGKGRAPDLRAKALQNALGTNQKPYAPVFTERSSISSSNLSMLSSVDNSSMINPKPKPSAIFNPAEASNKQAPSIFTRPFAPVPATSSASTAQQRLVHNLLKEAEQDKRAGMPIGTTLPTRSPARFNALRHAFDSANAISLSTDDDTMSTRAGENDVQTDMYGNEVFGGQLDDSYSDSDEDEDEDEDDGDPGGHIAHMPVMPEQYSMEEGDSFESTGWHADNHDGTTNVFAGGRAAPSGGAFQLADIYRGVEPDSFVAETPIISRRAEPRHLG